MLRGIMYDFVLLFLQGDDDPIDVVDLSTKDRKLLDVVKVKVLGAFCLIDQGELDWKVLVMDVEEAQQKNVFVYYETD